MISLSPGGAAPRGRRALQSGGEFSRSEERPRGTHNMISRHPLSPSPTICVGAAGPSHPGPSPSEPPHTHTRPVECVCVCVCVWHTNRHDINKIKRVGLRQNMHGPLKRADGAAGPLGCSRSRGSRPWDRRADRLQQGASASDPAPSIPIWVTTKDVRGGGGGGGGGA